MKRGYLKTIFLGIGLAVCLYQCSGCEDGTPVQAEKPNKEDIARIMLDKSRPEWKQIETSLTNHLNALAAGDIKTYLSYSNPKLFADSSYAQTEQALIDVVQQGIKTSTENVQLIKVSPLVSDSANNYAVFWFDANMIISFDERFTGNPSGFRMQIEDTHGKDAVAYDEENRKYYVTRTFKMYGESPIDSEKWYFLDEFFHGTSKGDALMDFEILFDLRKFEK